MSICFKVEFKKHSVQELPRIKDFSIAIQLLGTYVIVMGVSNLPSTRRESMGNLISKIIMAMKLAYGPVHRRYIKSHI